jgi:TonB family protein
MKQGLLLIENPRKRKPARVAVPTFLVTLEPWHKSFLRNLADLFRFGQRPPLRVVSRSADFWPDVFVSRHLPWGRFLQSALCHILVIATLWGWARLWPQRQQIAQPPVFHSSDVVYYKASEYLPPLNTGGTDSHLQKKGEPEYAAQPIISVPPEADNRTQTVVAPPKLKLSRDVPLPNVVAWSRPQPTIPVAVSASSASDVKLPVLPTSAVAPPPDMRQTEMNRAPAFAESAVAPAPQVENASSRRLTDINIGHTQVVAPTPQLPMSDQRSLASMATTGNAAAVVPPPPSLQGSGTAKDGRLIALNLRPVAPGAPVDVPAGNRRGTFAATPEGRPGAAGTPDMPADNRHAAAGGVGPGSGASGAPPGLLVGASPTRESGAAVAGSADEGASKTRSSDNARLLASATPPRVSSVPRRSDLPANAMSELERKVFGGRKSYSMTLNVPNLNSAGGSWVMHFAEMKEGETPGDLIAPVATQAVDPGYPIELMRQNVQGTVTLSAVIRSDGSVGEVRVLQGVDDRLDQYASAAMLRWRFRPATRNGEAVALQAVVMIPFRLRKAGF